MQGSTAERNQSNCQFFRGPQVIALTVLRAFLLVFSSWVGFMFFMRLVLTGVGFGWATFAAMRFLGDSQPVAKKAMAVYPIFLFYFIISWLIVSHSE